MALPGARDGDVSGAERVFLAVGAKFSFATEHVANFDALIAVHGQTPALRSDGVPVADCAQPGEFAMF